MSTSTTRPRGRAAFLAAVAVLSAAALWGYLAMESARDDAAAAAADLAGAQRSAERIAAARRGSGGPAATLPADPDDLRRKIVRAVTAAAIAEGEPQEGLQTIIPHPPRRVPNTAFEERPTDVLLRQVTLRQVVTFLSVVTADAPGLRVTEVRISGSGEANDTELWTAEATLSFFVYAPDAAARTANADARDGGGR